MQAKVFPFPPLRTTRLGLIRCRVCGCTETQACNPPCSWSDVDLCSGCYEAAEALNAWIDGSHTPALTKLRTEARRMRQARDAGVGWRRGAKASVARRTA